MTEKERQERISALQEVIDGFTEDMKQQLLRFAEKVLKVEYDDTETKAVTFRENGQPYCPECGYYLKADIPQGCVYEFPHCPECGVSLSWNSSERVKA